MFPLPSLELKVAAGLLALAGAAALAAWLEHRGDVVCRAEVSAAALKATQEAQAKVDTLTAQLRASEDAHISDLRKAHDETNRLRDAVAAGPVRLRVAAKCPAVPEASAASGVDPGAGAELDPAARPAYFALRDGIDSVSAKLSACQAELRLRAK